MPIYDRTGAEVGKYEIDPAQLAPRISKQLLHDAVVMYQNNLRLGSAKTKTRSEVAGTTKKMYRQKGTGNARAGSRRSGVRRGGGHIHAKRPRDWSYRLPKKALQLATRMAVASRIADDEVTLIDKLAFEQPKTREWPPILKALKLDGTSLLVAVPGYDVEHVQEHPQPGRRVGGAGGGVECLERIAAEAVADDHFGVGCLRGEKKRSARRGSETDEEKARRASSVAS